MKMKTRKQDSNLIKKSLKHNIPDAIKLSVSAGKGTSYGWWHVYVDIAKKSDCTCVEDKFGRIIRCESCKVLYSITYQKAIESVRTSGIETSSFYADDGYNTKRDCINAHVELV